MKKRRKKESKTAAGAKGAKNILHVNVIVKKTACIIPAAAFAARSRSNVMFLERPPVRSERRIF